MMMMIITTVEHIVCGCSKLAEKGYKRRHDTLARVIHWELCKVYDLQYSRKWPENRPEGVTKNEEVKILWHFTNKLYYEISSQSSWSSSALGTLSSDAGENVRKTIVLISKTLAVHMRYNLWYISLPSSARQRREMTTIKVFWRTTTPDD